MSIIDTKLSSENIILLRNNYL